MTFDEWWDKEGRDLLQRSDFWLVAQAAWNAAKKDAATQDKTLSGVCPEPAAAAPLHWYIVEQNGHLLEPTDAAPQAVEGQTTGFPDEPRNPERGPAVAAPRRWNPNTSSMEPHNYLDDQGMSKK